MKKRTDLDKLNAEVLKASTVIKAHEAGIMHAKAGVMETASKVVVDTDKVIKEAQVAKQRAITVLEAYGA